jgi:riboflavin kinase/FMN adenylyltransferase
MLEQLAKDGIPYSSSMVRSMIENGDVEGVVPFLGRCFSVEGEVVHGLHRGKELGFPTANVLPEEELLPKPGVYAVKVLQGEMERYGACNIGFNPTFNHEALSVEVYIFDFEGDLYGRRLKICFVRRIRDERAFSDVGELREAIEKDVAICREILCGPKKCECSECIICAEEGNNLKIE